LARPEERPAEPAPAIDQSSRSDRPAASAAPSSGRRTLGYAVLAIGGAAVITGGVFGLLAIGSKSSLDDACKDKACPPEQDRKISSLKTQSTLSTIFVAAGGAVAAGGLVLVLTAPNAPATTALHVGPGSIALERRF
jgi:hypothetical protein